MKKLCTTCKISKGLEKFSKNKYREDGLQLTCKICNKKRQQKYRRTFKGFLSRIYSQQRACSKHRNQPMPVYTKQELGVWVKSQKNFQELWKNWADSDYKKMLIPSVDRLDDYKGYRLDNIQLMAWRENKSKAPKDIKEGKNNKQSKAVFQIDKFTGKVLKEFHSARHGGRETGISNSSISACCRGSLKSAGGFKWKYKE